MTDTLVVESLFGAPPRPTFAIMAERLLLADRLLYRGAHAGAICAVMSARGIVTQCDTTPRGERTLFQSATRGVPIPENSPTGVTSTITIDDAPIAEAALATRLAEIAAQPQPAEGRRIYLRADRTLDYGRVMRVMGELNRAGLNRVALVSVGPEQQ